MTTLDRAQEALDEAVGADHIGDHEVAHLRLDDALLLLAHDLARPGRQDRARQTRLARELVEQWRKGRRLTS